MASISTDLGLPSLSGASATVQKWGGWAFGFGTPGQQLLATTVIFLVALVSSTVSFGATLIIAALAFVWFWLGVLRLIPQVNAYWPLG